MQKSYFNFNKNILTQYVLTYRYNHIDISQRLIKSIWFIRFLSSYHTDSWYAFLKNELNENQLLLNLQISDILIYIIMKFKFFFQYVKAKYEKDYIHFVKVP